MTLPVLLATTWFLVVMLLILGPSAHATRTRPRRTTSSNEARRGACRPKPPWVRLEVLRLKALMPENGCRKIADTFNATFERRRRMTVGKSFVAAVIKAEGYRIAEIRRGIRRRRPRIAPRNLIWGLDLTTIAKGDERAQILGIVDHGTRACLALEHVRTKASIALLRVLLGTIERFGRPRTIMTDNEAVFTSRLFRFGLWLLGIRHRRTAPFAPWQNGRVERFFGTLKPLLRRRRPDTRCLQRDLGIFRRWYNHVRPHQHLGGRSPAQAWDPSRERKRREPVFVSEWDGLLRGFYFW